MSKNILIEVLILPELVIKNDPPLNSRISPTFLFKKKKKNTDSQLKVLYSFPHISNKAFLCTTCACRSIVNINWYSLYQQVNFKLFEKLAFIYKSLCNLQRRHCQFCSKWMQILTLQLWEYIARGRFLVLLSVTPAN